MRTAHAGLVGVAALAVAVSAAAQRGQGAPPLVQENATQKISDHVYVIPDGNVGMVPNIGIVVGARGTLVIDTGLGARNGETVVREVRKVSETPELYLASTHVHPEHDLGATGFPPQTKMIRSKAQLQEIADGALGLAQKFAAISPLHADLLKGAEFRKADITYDQEYVLDLGGGVRVRIMAMGHNHTRGDQAFFVEPDAVLFSGDVTMAALPNVGTAPIAQWLASQERFEKLQPKRIVPSHGPMGDLSFVRTYKSFLETVQTRAAELKRQGRTLDEAEQILVAELASQYPNGGQRLRNSIRAAYNQARGSAP